MQLSILIPTLESRRLLLRDLLVELHGQIRAARVEDQVEVRTRTDGGEEVLGIKRNALLDAARGRFICFVDDDDWVAPDYVPTLLNATYSNAGDEGVDVVGIVGEITRPGQAAKRFVHSLAYDADGEDDEKYFRRPNHLNPVRREAAVEAGFPALLCGEDSAYSARLAAGGRLKREVFVPRTMYFYRFDPATTETQR
jgi:glycosyltransferase involved in cell wall biosynthesis